MTGGCSVTPLQCRDTDIIARMGYFAGGFVFTSDPRFAEIAAGFPTYSARGYRHVERPIWLLDVFEKAVRGEHYPFSWQTTEIQAAPRAPAPATIQFLRELDALLAALPDDEDGRGANELRLALAVGECAGTRTCFFAGDDDLVDLACVVADGTVERFRCRMEHLTVAHEPGRTEVIPNVLVENDEEEPSPALLQAIRGAVPWPVAPAYEVVGRQIHESARLLWPAEAGDPVESLGLGTWDFGEPLARHFRVVFDKPAP